MMTENYQLQNPVFARLNKYYDKMTNENYGTQNNATHIDYCFPCYSICSCGESGGGNAGYSRWSALQTKF